MDGYIRKALSTDKWREIIKSEFMPKLDLTGTPDSRPDARDRSATTWRGHRQGTTRQGGALDTRAEACKCNCTAGRTHLQAVV